MKFNSIFCHSVFLYCQSVNGSVTSWIRTPKRNSAVGGVFRSLHLSAEAMDVVVDDPLAPSPDERHTLAATLGLRLLIEEDHDHLEFIRPPTSGFKLSF